MAIPRRAQNAAHHGFVALDAAYDCTACIRWHADAYGFPMLEERDVEAWNLFLLLQDQQRIGMEPIGLDYAVLPAVFDLIGVPPWRRRTLFGELVVLNHAVERHRSDERAREQAERAAKQGG